MSQGKDFKGVQFYLDPPFEHIEVNVMPVSRNFVVVGHSVGVMDTIKNEGTRYFSLDYPDALARGILKATKSYRRKNAAQLVYDEEERASAAAES